MEQEKNDSSVKSLIDKAGDYLETRIDLVKLKTAKSTSEIVSTLLGTIVTLVVGLFFISLLNIALALLIGDWLGEAYYGFFVMAGLYLLIGIIVYACRKQWVETPVSNKIIQKMTRL